jgi:hypothetical protein
MTQEPFMTTPISQTHHRAGSNLWQVLIAALATGLALPSVTLAQSSPSCSTLCSATIMLKTDTTNFYKCATLAKAPDLKGTLFTGIPNWEKPTVNGCDTEDEWANPLRYTGGSYENGDIFFVGCNYALEPHVNRTISVPFVSYDSCRSDGTWGPNRP